MRARFFVNLDFVEEISPCSRLKFSALQGRNTPPSATLSRAGGEGTGVRVSLRAHGCRRGLSYVAPSELHSPANF